MAVDNLSLSIIVNELEKQMVPSTFGRPFSLGNGAYAIPFSEVLSENNIRHGSFIFTMEPTNPFACYSLERFEKIQDNSPFFNSLKKLAGGRVTSIKKHQGERILKIHIEASKEDITEVNDSYDFILELFPNRPNCYIIAYPYGKIVSLYHEHTDIEKGIFVTRNALYQYPEERASLPTHLNEPEEARPYLPNATLRYLKQYVLEEKHDLDDTLNQMMSSKDIYIIKKDIVSFSFGKKEAEKVKVSEIYTHFFSNQKELAKLNKIKELVALIEKAIKIAKKKLINLNNDLSTAKDRMKYLEYGQMIYLYQGEIKKGDKILKRDGYEIPLNPLFDAPKNANNYFKKYQKAKTALKILDELILKTKDEVEYLEKKLDEAKDGTPRDVMELKSELLQEGYIKEKQGRNTVYKVSKKHRYDPHYIILKEGKIGFGMNGLQNEELTFNIAKKDDLFLHVKDFPGSHVVILEGKDNKKIRETAMELSLYLSHMDNGTVMIAKRKDVKKNPNKVGLVNILHYETAVVKYIRPESVAIFKKELKKD